MSTNTIKCINERFAFKNSRILCLALIFNLNNLRSTILYAKKREKRRVIYGFFE